MCLALGLAVGIVGAYRVKMIQMPQAVALLNGFGGAASALVAAVSLMEGLTGIFSLVTAGLALAVGMITLTGSLIAAGKLQKLISQRPVVWKGHSAIVGLSIVLTAVTVALAAVPTVPVWLSLVLCLCFSGFLAWRSPSASAVRICRLRSLCSIRFRAWRGNCRHGDWRSAARGYRRRGGGLRAVAYANYVPRDEPPSGRYFAW